MACDVFCQAGAIVFAFAMSLLRSIAVSVQYAHVARIAFRDVV
jgi:hypothetical protein